MDAGILPVKSLAEAKTRLGAAYGEEARVEIARALLSDALTLCATADLLTWLVVSDDPDVLASAARAGFSALGDPGPDLNAALRAGIAGAQEMGATSVTIVPADVPLAWRGDIEDVLDTGATSDVVVVPSGDGGTNCLYLEPPNALEPRFGPGSLAAHLAAAERVGLRCSLLNLPRLQLDIDTPEDATALLERPRHEETHTGRALARMAGSRS
ncbi:MAG TPA: 2-phospho-L-lactate guanylyltransferase [Actinomycetota bacterium]|nr:2-phospho-L-lactate guanylyltransferase [Actinomycetota bacterium]